MQLWYRLRLGEKLSILKKMDTRFLIGLMGSSFILATVCTIGFEWFILSGLNKSKKKAVQQKPQSLAVLEKGRVGITPSEEKVILERNLFNSEGGEQAVEEVKVIEDPLSADIPKSKLPFVLKGVIVADIPSKGIAMIELSGGSTGASKTYDVGENFGSRYRNVTLSEVYESRVILLNNGKKEYLEIERPPPPETGRRKSKTPKKKKGLAPLATGPASESFKEPGFERSGGDITLTQQYRDTLLGSQMTKVLQDAKASPNMVGSELKGFKLTRIREGSIYQKAGLQSGDIIHEINGIALRGVSGAIKTLQSVRNEREIEVRIQRGGEFINLNVSVQ